MSSEGLKCGACTLVRSVRNPIKLARAVMERTPHILLSGGCGVCWERGSESVCGVCPPVGTARLSAVCATSSKDLGDTLQPGAGWGVECVRGEGKARFLRSFWLHAHSKLCVHRGERRAPCRELGAHA